MTTATTEALRPALLVDLLTSEAVLRAARRILDAELRLQRLRLIPATERGDTASNGQPWRRALGVADSERQQAALDLAEAVRRAAEQIASREVTA